MRTRTLAAGAAAALAVSATVAWAPSDPAGAQSTPPNIVVVMADDQTLESMRFMPKVAANVAAAGTTFTNTVVSYSLCCPSRAGYLSGQFGHNNGVLGNNPPAGGYSKLDHTNTLPVWLQRAGYHTTHIGKYLNNYTVDAQPSIPPGYDDWQGLIDPTTYRMYDYTINDNGVPVTYGTTAADYQTDVLATRAEETIRARAPSAQPFFLTVTPLAPHTEGASDTYSGGPPRPAPRHMGIYSSEPMPQPPSYNEADVSDKPSFIRDRVSFTQQDTDTVTHSYRRRIRSLLAVDDLVERLVAALRETGDLANTIFVYTSDNGYFHGEHRVPSGKTLVYEPSILVPLMVRGPGFAPGVRAQAPASNLDLTATIVEAAGATAGRVLDGRSLKTVAAGEAAMNRPQYNESGAPGVAFRYHQAVRVGGWKYVEHSNGERELYDLINDPHELVNRYGDPGYSARASELAARLQTLRTCKGATCVSGEPAPGTAPQPITTPRPGATPGSSGGANVMLRLISRRVRLDRRGRAAVTLSCAASSEDGCQGTLSLEARIRKRGRTVGYMLGRKRFALAIGRTAAVRVPVRSSGRRLLRRRRSTSVRATALVRDVTGDVQRIRRTYRVRAR